MTKNVIGIVWAHEAQYLIQVPMRLGTRDRLVQVDHTNPAYTMLESEPRVSRIGPRLFLAGKKGKPLACNSRERTFESQPHAARNRTKPHERRKAELRSYVKILEEHTNVSLESAAEEMLFGSRKQSKRPRSLLRFMEK